MSKFITVIKTISNILLLIVFCLAALFVVPKWFGINPYVVLSGSMEPEIPVGSVAFINTRETDFVVDDIITYRISESNKQQETLVTHRIISEENGQYVTKGDANDTADFAKIKDAQIVGKFLFAIPYAGYLLEKLQGQLLIVILCWIWFLYGISFLLNEIKAEERKRK